jgi:hypothetical protein
MAIVDKLSAVQGVRDLVSARSVERGAVSWMKARTRRTTAVPMTDWILWSLGDVVSEKEVWVPIAGTHVESDLPIGNVVIRPITREMIDQWNAEMLPRAGRTPFDRNTEKNLIGLAAATISITAEPDKAFEVALDEAELATAVLRFYLPENFSPSARSHCLPLGREHAEKHFVIALEADGMFRQCSYGFSGDGLGRYSISDELVGIARAHGLEDINALLRVDKRSEFQEKLLASWLLYSRHSLAPSLTERTVYVFAALESLLLKNSSEPIQSGVGDRLAFLSSNDGAARRAIVDRFKAAYDHRSKIVHHGRARLDQDVREVMKAFLFDVWVFYRALFRQRDQYATRDDMFLAIDRMKYG